MSHTDETPLVNRIGLSAEERIERIELSVERLVNKLDHTIDELRKFALFEHRLGMLEKIVYGLCAVVGMSFMAALIALIWR